MIIITLLHKCIQQQFSPFSQHYLYESEAAHKSMCVDVNNQNKSEWQFVLRKQSVIRPKLFKQLKVMEPLFEAVTVITHQETWLLNAEFKKLYST